ncbi:MAG TPA: hypothetical protein VMC10_23830 [Stellaceae bacterium]|nr:hypothetical protein [Stellaceae bacterium]
MEEFRRLRDHIARRLGVPGQRAPEGGLVSFERWITRENVRRYRDLLKDVKDPHRRSALEWLLSEEERKFSAQEQSDPRNRAKRWHAKAEELRTIADHTPSPAARETFLRLAENYEKLAVDAEGPTRRGTAGPTKDTA